MMNVITSMKKETMIIIGICICVLCLSSLLYRVENDAPTTMIDHDDDNATTTTTTIPTMYEANANITFGEPIYAATTIDHHHIWCVDMYTDRTLYEVNVTSTMNDSFAWYAGNNVVMLTHIAIENRTIYRIEFLIEYRMNEYHNLTYGLICVVDY